MIDKVAKIQPFLHLFKACIAGGKMSKKFEIINQLIDMKVLLFRKQKYGAVIDKRALFTIFTSICVKNGKCY